MRPSPFARLSDFRGHQIRHHAAVLTSFAAACNNTVDFLLAFKWVSYKYENKALPWPL